MLHCHRHASNQVSRKHKHRAMQAQSLAGSCTASYFREISVVSKHFSWHKVSAVNKHCKGSAQGIFSRSGWPKSRMSHAVIIEMAKMKQYATLADVFMMDWVVQLAMEHPSQAAMLAKQLPAQVATNMSQDSDARWT